jgi:hypothetical protein
MLTAEYPSTKTSRKTLDELKDHSFKLKSQNPLHNFKNPITLYKIYIKMIEKAED